MLDGHRVPEYWRILHATFALDRSGERTLNLESERSQLVGRPRGGPHPQPDVDYPLALSQEIFVVSNRLVTVLVDADEFQIRATRTERNHSVFNPCGKPTTPHNPKAKGCKAVGSGLQVSDH